MQIRDFALVVVLCLLPSTAAAAQDGTPGPEIEALSPPLAGDLAEILERRTIRVLVTHNRTNFFVTRGGQPRGFEYELLQEYERALQKRVKGRFQMLFFPVPFDQLLTYLEQGRGDIAAAGLTITPERQARVAFTDPYLTQVDEVVVTHQGVRGLESLDDLAGRRVHVVGASSYIPHLRAKSAELEGRGLAALEVVEAPSYLESEDLLELVHAGVVDVMVVDRHVAELWSSTLGNLVVRADLAVHSGGRIAWAVGKENAALLADLNTFVAQHRKGTLLGNVFFKRYFKNTAWIKSPSAAEQRRLDEMRALFQKYGERYGFDWLTLAALSFQESKLDQSVKSRSGAVGVMQIKPSTAADHNVAIGNVHELENNIHAGTKYLDFLRRRYFNEPEISPGAKIDFVLAAYNAGPARVRSLRKQAAAAGYDPNQWFHNVERTALSAVGWEPVHYVANIHKYYYAFQLTRAALGKRQEGIEALREGY